MSTAHQKRQAPTTIKVVPYHHNLVLVPLTRITRRMRHQQLVVALHVPSYLARVYRLDGPCSWRQTVASSSSITSTRKRHGSIRVLGERVRCRTQQITRRLNGSPKMNWDRYPKDGKNEFTRMDEFSLLIIVSVKLLQRPYRLIKIISHDRYSNNTMGRPTII